VLKKSTPRKHTRMETTTREVAQAYVDLIPEEGKVILEVKD